MESLTGYQHPWGTCDWGECDEPATEWRLSETHLMHLPVCERHSTDTELRAVRKALDDVELNVSNALRPLYATALRARHQQLAHIETFAHCFLCSQEKVAFDEALRAAIGGEQ